MFVIISFFLSFFLNYVLAEFILQLSRVARGLTSGRGWGLCLVGTCRPSSLRGGLKSRVQFGNWGQASCAPRSAFSESKAKEMKRENGEENGVLGDGVGGLPDGCVAEGK